MAEEKTVKIKDASIVNIPTQYQVGFEIAEGKVVSLEELFLEIYNKLSKIERVLGAK